MRVLNPLLLCLAVACSLSTSAVAQAPRINTLFPIGGKAGTTVEVEVRGSGLVGADRVVANSPGLTGSVAPGGAKVDEKFRPLFQSKCGGCHELRSPSNRSMTPAQWAATVDRMVKVRQAPLSASEAENVSQYLQSMARAGRVTAQVRIAPETPPGVYEVRVGTAKGISTACLFEVGALREVVGVSSKMDSPVSVTLPCVANGSLSGTAERHFYRFTAKKDQRLVFDLKGFRYNEASQMYFNPNLRLYDAQGTEVAESHGYYDLDPLIDWTCLTDGDYTLEVRDLLGRGNPGNVYRLTMGPVAYDTVAYPPAAKAGTKADPLLLGRNMAGSARAAVTIPAEIGIASLPSGGGPVRMVATPFTVITEEARPSGPLSLPSGFAGRIQQAGETDSFTIQGGESYEFEVFGSRLGSGVSPTLQVLDARGRAVGRAAAEGRVVVKLDPKQVYTLRVEDSGGRPGPEAVYYVEARPAGPAVRVVARPDAVALRPGTSTAVDLVVLRRDRVEGNIEVVAENLPAGVTASRCVISPDRQEASLVLTAAPGAAVSEQPIRFVAVAKGAGGETREAVVPQEIYLLNNQPRYISRSQCVLTVRGAPDVSVSLEGMDSAGSLRVHPRKGVELKVRVERKGEFKGPVTVSIKGLPAGWVGSTETIPAGKIETKLVIRPDGGSTQPFLRRDAALPSIVAVIEAAADDYPSVVAALTVRPAEKIEEEPKPER